MTPAEKPKPSLTPSACIRARDRPVSSACTTYSSGATNMNANSSGSVTPVTNDVSAAANRMEPATLRLRGSAWRHMASAAAGSPNIITGKKPVMNMPALGSPCRKRLMSPWYTWPFGAV